MTKDQRDALVCEGLNIVDLDRPTRIHVGDKVIDTGYRGANLRDGSPGEGFTPWIRCCPAAGTGACGCAEEAPGDEGERIAVAPRGWINQAMDCARPILGIDRAGVEPAFLAALEQECPKLYLIQLRSLDPCLPRTIFSDGWTRECPAPEPLAYYNQATYLARLTHAQIETIRKHHTARVKAVIGFTPEMKIDIGLGERLKDMSPLSVYRVCVSLACPTEGADPAARFLAIILEFMTMAFAQGLNAEIPRVAKAMVDAFDGESDGGSPFFSFTTHMPAIAMRKLAKVPAVFRIEPAPPIHAEGEVASLVAAGIYVDHAQAGTVSSYCEWLKNKHKVDPSTITVGVNDFGIDPNHPALADRVACGRGCAESDHGTQVAGRVAGGEAPSVVPSAGTSALALARDEDGFRLDLGQAPGASLIDLDVRHKPSVVAQQCVTTKGANDITGSILVNSWGRGISHPQPMGYGCQESDWDLVVRDGDLKAAGNQQLIVCKSAGNYGRRGLSRPAGAKNLIVTGSTKNLRRRLRGHWDVDSLACSDLGKMHNCSSAGNCGDGRLRPDLVAPGWPVFTASCARHPRVVASAEPPSSSLANATVAGACAVIQAWWKEMYKELPSPALVRALLVNAAVDTEIEGERPNPWQGWGRIDIERVLTLEHGTNALIFDQADDRTLSLCGGTPRPFWPKVFRPCTLSEPLIVTLAWTDPPGSPGTGTAGNPSLVNPLRLRLGGHAKWPLPWDPKENVEPTWLGNNFSQGRSLRGGVADAMQTASPGQIVNNVQQVIIPKGHKWFRGRNLPRYRVVVEALDLRGDALKPTCPFAWTRQADGQPKQDFALVVRNAKSWAWQRGYC